MYTDEKSATLMNIHREVFLNSTKIRTSISTDRRGQNNGQITYANEVISTIVSVATTEVDGISAIAGNNGLPGKGKFAARGRRRVDMNGEDVSVDVSVTVDYGMPIQKVGRSAQENVRKSIESMTGLHVEKVDLHVVGVSFEKENEELQQSQKIAMSLEEEEEQHALEEGTVAQEVPAPAHEEAEEEAADSEAGEEAEQEEESSEQE